MPRPEHSRPRPRPRPKAQGQGQGRTVPRPRPRNLALRPKPRPRINNPDENQKESSVQSLWRHASSQLSVSDHTTSAPVAARLFQPTQRSSVLAHHTGRYQRSSAQSFRHFIGLRCVFCNIMCTERAAFWSLFQQRNSVCKISDCTWKKRWWLSPPLFKGGGHMHRHIQSYAYGKSDNTTAKMTVKIWSV